MSARVAKHIAIRWSWYLCQDRVTLDRNHRRASSTLPPGRRTSPLSRRRGRRRRSGRWRECPSQPPPRRSPEGCARAAAERWEGRGGRALARGAGLLLPPPPPPPSHAPLAGGDHLALAQLVPQCRHALALLLAQHAERSEGVRLRGERRDGDRRHHLWPVPRTCRGRVADVSRTCQHGNRDRVAQIRRRVPRNDTRRQLRSLGRIGRRAAVAVAATVVAFGRRRRRQTWELCVDLPAGSSLPLWGLAGEHAHLPQVSPSRACA